MRVSLLGFFGGFAGLPIWNELVAKAHLDRDSITCDRLDWKNRPLDRVPLRWYEPLEHYLGPDISIAMPKNVRVLEFSGYGSK